MERKAAGLIMLGAMYGKVEPMVANAEGPIRFMPMLSGWLYLQVTPKAHQPCV